MARLAVAGAGAVAGAVIGSIIPGVGTMLGAQLGWAAGSLLGAAFIPEQLPGTTGPRLDDLQIQTSGYGIPVALVDGQAKLSGNVIWSQDIIEEVTSRKVKQSGKGAGSVQRVTEYRYFGNFAVGLCNWLRPQANPRLLRIWLDTTLVYDATGENAVTQIPGLVFRWYDGDEAQTPDPLITRIEGADAPYYRGLSYIVFERLPLETFGNSRLPNVTVEFCGNAADSNPEIGVTAPPSVEFPTASHFGAYYTWPTRPNFCVDQARGRIYEYRRRNDGQQANVLADFVIRVIDLQSMQGIAEHNMADICGPLFPAINSETRATWPSTGFEGGLMHLGVDGFLYLVGGGGNVTALYKIDPDAWSCRQSYGTPGLSNTALNDNAWQLSGAFDIASFKAYFPTGDARTFLVIIGAWSFCRTIDAETMTFIWGQDSAKSPVPPVTGSLGISPQTLPFRLIPGRVRPDGQAELWFLRTTWDPGRLYFHKVIYSATAAPILVPPATEPEHALGITTVIDIPEMDLTVEAGFASAPRLLLHGGFYDEADDTLVLTVSTNGGTGTGMTHAVTMKVAPDGPVGGRILWQTPEHPLGGVPASSGAYFHGGAGSYERASGAVWGQGGGPLIQRGTGDILVAQTGSPFTTWYWLDDQVAVLGYADANDVSVPREIRKRYLGRSSANGVLLSDIVRALCLRSGMTLTQVDVAALTDSVRGITLARPMSGRDAIQPLATAYAFHAVEQDGRLVFRKRGAAPVATIPYEDLLRTGEEAPVLEETRAQDQDLPAKVTIRAPDITRGWEQNAQSWDRPRSPTRVMASANEVTVDIPIPLTPDEMRSIAKRGCLALWRARTKLSFTLGSKYLGLAPCDSIIVTFRDGSTQRVGILRATIGANWTVEIEAETEDAAVFAVSATGDSGEGYRAPAIPRPYFGRFLSPDLPLLTDADDANQAALIEYAFVLPYQAEGWRGFQLYRNADGTNWDLLAGIPNRIAWGATLDSLAPPATPFLTDATNLVDLRMTVGTLDSVTELEMLNGANLAFLLAPSGGRVEFLQFQAATDLGQGRYQLSALIRGRRGTEDAAREPWPSGSLFVLLMDDEARSVFSTAPADLNDVHRFKGLNAYQGLADAETISKAFRGRAEQPYAPWGIAGSRDGSGNLAITWQRRTRLSGEWKDYVEILPLNEGAEAYDLDILSGPPASFKSYSASGGTAANAFDGNSATETVMATSSIPRLAVAFAEPQTIRAYAVVAGTFASSDGPKDWVLEVRDSEPVYAGSVGTPANLWLGTEWTASDTYVGSAWSQISFATPRSIAAYGVQAASYASTDGPKAWSLYGSNDGVAFDLIDNQSGQAFANSEEKSFILVSPVTYRHVRFVLHEVANAASAANFRIQALNLRDVAGGPSINGGWTLVDTRTSQTAWTNGQVRSFALAAPVTGVEWRLRVTAGNGGSNTRIAELRLFRGGAGDASANIAASTYAPLAKRTITVASPAASYAAADQVSDFGATQPEIFLTIAQRSALVGRGIAAEAIL